MDTVPELAVNDGLVLAGIGGALVHGIANVGPVLEQLVKYAFIDCLAVPVTDAFLPEFMGEKGGRLQDQKSLEDRADRRGVRLVHYQLAIRDLIPERGP